MFYCSPSLLNIITKRPHQNYYYHIWTHTLTRGLTMLPCILKQRPIFLILSRFPIFIRFSLTLNIQGNSLILSSILFRITMISLFQCNIEDDMPTTCSCKHPISIDSLNPNVSLSPTTSRSDTSASPTSPTFDHASVCHWNIYITILI